MYRMRSHRLGEDLPALYDDEGVARCPRCGGVLRPGVVLFGESLPQGVIERSYELADNADLFVCVGSSLKVSPAANIPIVAKRAGTKVVIVNRGPTAYTEAEIVVDDDVNKVLPQLVQRVLAG